MKELLNHIKDRSLREISEKALEGKRITAREGNILFSMADLPLLGLLSGINRRRYNGNYAFFNRNFHIEPTNICIHNCLFCSYHKKEGEPESWDHSHETMIEMVRRFGENDVTEVHITGGVHPEHDIVYYGELLKKIRKERPSLHIKAFSAVELDIMISKAGMEVQEGLTYLRECGLDSIPGGGAEIFDTELRKRICADKSSSDKWLYIHETAHKMGICSNATMLYGHLESYSHRISHMERLRDLQDRTGGFKAFIPLKFRKANNRMDYLGEVSLTEDLRNYAVARIFLDNIPHIKAYWPMTGKETAQLSLSFGTDDLDGTIEDSTRIYSMAGAEDKNPAMTTDEICTLIRQAGFEPAERDSCYNLTGWPAGANNL